MFRVYDNYQKRWVLGDIYASTNGDLYILKKGFFKKRMQLVSDERYIIHKYIGLYDKNNQFIYEGDYVKAEVSDGETIIGMVTFAHEFASYIILCDENSKYYILGSEVCKYVEIIGNVFDGIEE